MSSRAAGSVYQDIQQGGRFAFINRMLYLRQQDDTKELMRVMQEYKKLDILSGKMFKII